LGQLTRKTVSEMTYNVSSGTLNSTIPFCHLTLVMFVQYLTLHKIETYVVFLSVA